MSRDIFGHFHGRGHLFHPFRPGMQILREKMQRKILDSISLPLAVNQSEWLLHWKRENFIAADIMSWWREREEKNLTLPENEGTRVSKAIER